MERALLAWIKLHFIVHSQANSSLLFSNNVIFQMGSKQEPPREGG